MRFNENFFLSYVRKAPLALAIERSYECQILSKKEFQRPILDVGCGDGIFASVLFAEKVDVGVDPNVVELARASKENAYSELLECYGDRIPKPTGYFRTIFSNSVLEHIENIGAVLDECHRLLADGGTLYLTLPTDRFERFAFVSRVLEGAGLMSLAKRFQTFYNKFWAHFHAYDEEKWIGLFNSHGFKIHEQQLYDSKWSCLMNDVLAYLAIGSFFARKCFQRWFFFPAARRLVARIWFSLWSPLLDKPGKNNEFGLIFFELKKNGSC